MIGKRRGLLFLVVGPSGAGKDSVITGACRCLRRDKRFHFPKRVITRPQDAIGEDHVAATAETFAEIRAAGGLMLHWRAHGHAYGIPSSAADMLAEGTSVIANVSRQVIDGARRDWQPVRILLITAPRDVLRDRLMARGRETEADVERRLERADAYRVSGDDVREVVNADVLERAIERLVALIEEDVASAATFP